MVQMSASQTSSSSYSMSSSFGDFGTWGLALPIAQRGLFFRDSYFQRAREHFQNSVQNVLASYGLQQAAFADSLSNQSAFADSLQSYRKLRCDNHKEETQAVTAIEDDNNYKMVLDVREFQGGDLKVNVIGDHELLVEGKVDSKDGSAAHIRTFRQRFLLPRGIDIQESSSALSSDGILTIITPKVVQHQSQSLSTQTSTGRPRLMRAKSHIDRDNYSLFDNEFTTGMLPILRRGNFFSDSFFKEAHSDFNKAVSEVLSKSGIESNDAFSSYRSLRAKELKEETQVATVSEDASAQKIIIDVQDFINDGEVNVKVVEDKFLVVEGRAEKHEGEKTIVKQFKKQFTLSQHVELDSITSVVSADGVLAITAPKKMVVPPPAERKITLRRDVTGTPEAPSGGSTPAADPAQRREYLVPIILEDDDNEEIIEKEEEALHVASSLVEEEAAKLGSVSSVEAAPVQPSSVAELASTAGAHTSGGVAAGAIFAGMVPTGAAITGATPAALRPRRGGTNEAIPAFIAAVGSLPAGALLANAMSPTPASPEPTPPVSPPVPATPPVVPETPVQPTPPTPTPKAPSTPLPASVPESVANDPFKAAVINQLKDRRRVEPDSGAIRFPRAHGFVPVLKKGEFESDPYFEHDQEEFETAVKAALTSKGVEAAAGEELKTYKSLRKTSTTDEDVAFTFTEHAQGYKIVLDMEDYYVREPKLQILSDNDLIIEGVADRKDEEGESIYFRRQFVFPKVVNMDTITSAISSEGVLTVKAALKVAKVTKASEMTKEESLISTEQSVSQFNMMVGTYLDLQKRQSFATDTSFQEPKMHYPSAIRAALKRSGCVPEEGETESAAYMRLRKTNRKEENQAVMTIEGDDYYKVIVDMQEFIHTDIKVRLLGFNTFVVECYQEMSGKTKRIWSRQFVLPSHISMEKMTGSLSEDGMLVLTVPKRVWKHVGNTDASGIMRVGWVKTFPSERVFTSESCISGVCTPYKTLPFKGLRDW